MKTERKAPSPPERKRHVPGIIRGILKFDVYTTEKFCKLVDRFFPGRYYRKYYKMLEYTCHGIPWISCWLIFIWLVWSPSLFQMQINFLIGLLLDILLVALLKAYTRRARPPSNKPDMIGSVGPDKFSFPSGHVSRAVYIAFFFLYLHPFVNFFLRAPLLSWVTSLAASRILLRRHYILDVLGGFVLGLLEACFISYVWLGKDTCQWLVTFLSDEKMGDYD
uniref:Inactive phospholipid phosphatase 7 n=1 Tax=Cacopsylla melanoneura TaxID=428564 RepID=A0A8D9B9Q0_9HEMI